MYTLCTETSSLITLKLMPRFNEIVRSWIRLRVTSWRQPSVNSSQYICISVLFTLGLSYDKNTVVCYSSFCCTCIFHSAIQVEISDFTVYWFYCLLAKIFTFTQIKNSLFTHWFVLEHILAIFRLFIKKNTKPLFQNPAKHLCIEYLEQFCI